MEFGVLGPIRAVGDNGAALSAPQLRRLVGLLLTRPNQPVAADVLTEALWSNQPATPGKRLQLLIFRLRKELADPSRVAYDERGYALRVEPGELDAERFGLLYDEARAAPDQQTAAKLLREAVRLWRGEAFADVGDSPMASSEAARLSELRLAAEEALYAAELDDPRTDLPGLVGELQELASRHPLRERLHALLMTALFRADRQAEALEVYRAARDRLVDELGIEPGPELRRTQAAILEGELPASTESRAPTSTGGQLPADAATFVARDDELAELDAMVADGARLVVVSGTAGVGKTALAVHWAHQAAARFPDGRLYLNLRGYGPGEPVTPTVALAELLRDLGVPGPQVPDDVGARAGLLRSTLVDRSMLLVLDNVRDAAQVRQLLPASGFVVVTSRSQLRGLTAMDGARRLVLRRFEAETATRMLRSAAAVRNDDELDEVVALCGGLPLALTIAAERLGGHPVAGAAFAKEIRSRVGPLEALDTGDLRAVFSWSYGALSEEEARLFRLLGVQPGQEIGMPATAALLGTTTAEARRTMGRLLDAHLVEQTRPGHYQQHDLLRAYARDLANAEVVEAEAALDRWCRWLVHTVANGRRATAGGLPWYDFGEPGDVVPVEFGDAEQAMSWFEAERLNAAAAAADAAGRGWSRTVCHIAHLFWPYLFYRHDLDQIFELQRLALEAASVTGDLSVAATAETQLGATCLRAGDFEYAIEHAQAAVRHWEQTDSVIGLVTALGHLGFILQKSGRYEAALSRQREGLRLAAEPRDRMHALKYLAVTLVSMGRCEEAIAVCEEARPLLDLPGGSYLKPHVLDTHGQALAGTGSFEAAIDAYREAVAIFRVWAAPWSTALVLSHRGAAEEAIGRTDDARASYAEALALLDEIGAVDNEELSPADVRRRLASLSEVTPATG